MVSNSCNIDWLQINTRPLKEKIMLLDASYNLVDLPYSTQQFKLVQEVYKDGQRIATAVSKPHSEILDKDTIILKLDNNTLYQRNIYEYVQNLLSDLMLKFHNFSRVDIAIDFNKLNMNRCPERFMKAILSEKILCRNKGKIAFNGTRDHGVTLEYMRLGERSSGVVSYLYNKSLELEQKELKPWIVESWKENGLQTDQTVWRLEFSITDFNYVFVDKDTAEILEIDKLAFLLMARKPIVINSLINKYFSFVINNGKSRKDRMKKANIFGKILQSRHIEKISKGKASNRSTKILIKQLHKMNDELRNKDKRLSVSAYGLMNHIINRTALTDWYNRSNQHW